jgi:carbon storage regulator
MLVLSRKKFEEIFIGHNIRIVVVKIQGQSAVRLGFSAPSHITVHREEIYQAIQQQRREECSFGSDEKDVSSQDNSPNRLPRTPRGRPQGGFLVLARHLLESVIIGDDIKLTVVEIRGDKVRLGIDAPKEISVHRKEVYEAIQKENRQQQT